MGQNRHVCNDIYDEIHQIVNVQQLWRYKGDEQNFVITLSQISFHDAFSVYYDIIRSSQMCTFLVVITPEQERVSRAQYDTRDTYGWRIHKQYGHYNA